MTRGRDHHIPHPTSPVTRLPVFQLEFRWLGKLGRLVCILSSGVPFFLFGVLVMCACVCCGLGWRRDDVARLMDARCMDILHRYIHTLRNWLCILD